MKLVFIPYQIPLQVPPETDVIIDLTGWINNCKHPKAIIPEGNAYILNDYILNYSPPFLDLMDIVFPLYESKNVTVVYDGCKWEHICFIDTFEFFMYTRYDIVSNNINNIEDFPYLVDTDFSVRGLYNLDIDKDRAIKLTHGLIPYVPLPTTPPPLKFDHTKGLIRFGKPVVE